MKLGDILKTVGGGLISALVPGGPAIVAGINALLPNDKKIPESATGEQAMSAIQSLPPEQQKSVLEKSYDVEIEEIRGFTDRFKAMAQVDSTGNTTRPQIALMMALVVCFTIITTVSVYAYAVLVGDKDMIASVNNGWPLLVAIIGTPSALLRAYFAMRTKEKQHKYEAMTGTKAPVDFISRLFNK